MESVAVNEQTSKEEEMSEFAEGIITLFIAMLLHEPDGDFVA